MTKLEAIKTLKSKLDSSRPLEASAVKRLRENYIVRNTFHSNAIEGNTLTEMETRVIIESGITVAKKSLREHFEVTNHVEALVYIEELIDHALTEYDVKSIHSLILQGIDRRNAGSYRTVDVYISGASHSTSPAYVVHADMQSLLSWYSTQSKTIDTVIEFICKFIHIHPFIDGNGRTSRLLMNLELMKLGYPPITVKIEDCLEYFQALDKSYYKDYSLINDFFYDCIMESLNEHIAIAGI